MEIGDPERTYTVDRSKIPSRASHRKHPKKLSSSTGMRGRLGASSRRPATEETFPRIWQKKASGHSAPAGKCGCGIRGARDGDRAAGYIANAVWRDEPFRWPLLHRAIGCVALWGTIIECEDCWRASRAYPQRICLPKRGQSDDALAQPGKLAAGLSSYGVPAELIDCDLTSGDGVVSALEACAAVG